MRSIAFGRGWAFGGGVACVLAVFSAGACSGDDNDQGGHDAGRDATSGDASGGHDSAPDVTMADVGIDSGGGQDGGVDAPLEAGHDASSSDAGNPPSCAGGGDGLTNCGPTSESCCVSLAVPGGTFYRRYFNTGPVDAGPDADSGRDDAGAYNKEFPATVSSFRLDKYEVTVGRFRGFVAAWGAGWRPAAGAGKHIHLHGGAGLVNGDPDAGSSYEPGWVTADESSVELTDAGLGCTNSTFETKMATWSSSPVGRETKPINCVNWYEALAFCIWDGGFLASEAEWEYAAAGGVEQRRYPWGLTDPSTSGNDYAVFFYRYPDPDATAAYNTTNVAPVGTATLGAGRWGQVDISGDVYVWTHDWHDGAVGNGYFSVPCVDCAWLTPTAPIRRVPRGGWFGGGSGGLAPWSRQAVQPDGRAAGTGIRCSRVP